MSTIHKKVWPVYFEKILSGQKKLELRLADFDIQEGDDLMLEEWDPEKKAYTGRQIETTVTYVLKTKHQPFWPQEDVDRYGFQIIQFEKRSSEEQTAFRPRPGQVDFTPTRYAPVINCVVRHEGKILIVQRSPTMRWYPGLWNGISGFLDDQKSLEEKVKEELHEEVGIAASDVLSIHRGSIFHQEEPEYNKTWIVHPILVDVKTSTIKLDWEAQHDEWIDVRDLKKYQIVPGFEKVVRLLL
jgi:8-oxo-dGTP pyrophosphatase MutT (NUDIX family)